jgi:heptaprenyl diphosphate synthase
MASLPSQLRRFADRDLLAEIENDLEKIEAMLLDATAHVDPVQQQAARHLLAAGGKRVRPVLVLLAARLGSGVDKRVLEAATVVELTHLATLYHDDVMDDAPTRRGVATAQHVYGNSRAILIGDLLLARASKLSVELGIDAIRLQAATFERLCIGQLNESVVPEPDHAIDHYISVLADKTGSLIATSAVLGAQIAGASLEAQQALAAFGEKIGVAFQLIDDVIDISEAGPSGKTPGTDLRAHVPTMPVLLLRQQAKTDPAAAELLARIDSDLSSDEELASVVRALREHAVADQAYAEAQRWGREAMAALDVLPDSPTKRALIHFAEKVVERDN